VESRRNLPAFRDQSLEPFEVFNLAAVLWGALFLIWSYRIHPALK
jgi:hypothetical protein